MILNKWPHNWINTRYFNFFLQFTYILTYNCHSQLHTCGKSINFYFVLSQVLVAEAKAQEDKVKEMNEIVEKLKDLCDPATVEQRAASLTELHSSTS